MSSPLSPEDALVTYEQAQKHLRLLGLEDVEDLQVKLIAATAIVLDYIARPDEDWTAEIASWNNATVPPPVQAAILVQLGELYRFRGDDVHGEAPVRRPGYLNPMVDSLLRRFRDPSLA